MWLPWVPHISGTEHNPFSLPPLEPYGCLLTFVESQNLILKQVHRVGLRNECTWGLAKSWYELGRRRKTQRPVSESSSWSFWRKPPEVWHPVPITGGRGSRSVRQPGDISAMRVFKNQQGTSWKEQRTSKAEECGSIFLVFGSPALASFGAFNISMWQSAQFSHVILAFTPVH